MYKRILGLALPATAENFFQVLMGVVDNYLVAQLGLVAVSGVSVANNIITIYQAIFIAVGAVVSGLISKSLAQKNQGQTLYYQSETLFFTLVLGVMLGGFSIVFGESLLRLLGTEVAVSQVGGQYLSLVGGAVLTLGLMIALSAFLRAEGKARLPMYISLLTNVLNAVLSATFIFLFDWGVAGVAWGTILSRLVGVLLLASQLPMRTIVGRMRLHFDKELLALALPAAGERLMMRAGDVVIVAIIVSFGTEVVAGNAIGETLTQFKYMAGFGVATATVILAADSLGQDDKRLTRRLAHQSFILSTVIMFGLGSAIYLSREVLVQFFTTNLAAMEASFTVLFYSLLTGPATAGTLIYTAAWQGIGNAKLPFYATTFGMWVIRIGLGYVLGIICQWGLAAVCIATLLDNLFRWIFLAYCFHKKTSHN